MKMIVAFVLRSLAGRIVRVIERAGLYQLPLSGVRGVVRVRELDRG